MKIKWQISNQLSDALPSASHRLPCCKEAAPKTGEVVGGSWSLELSYSEQRLPGLQREEMRTSMTPPHWSWTRR
ncbi:hypothetical protein NDU88_007484 [Pleurodeles waltl]|uniref:Uncharacterized protein n=1 Tax=Pleurodeles waltl TaxID=8319 RepID=A0AAV7QL28_PLEWA|nr:hypothetical protein NDU88_007484 [Pleurodeles waltl]